MTLKTAPAILFWVWLWVGVTILAGLVGREFRALWWAALRNGSPEPRYGNCARKCDPLVTYPDDVLYCFRFGQTRPTLKRLED